MKKKMTVQTAAYNLLKELGKPFPSMKIAEMLLQRGDVVSKAKKVFPVISVANSLEKNIREDKYNDPRLIILDTDEGRKIGLPGMEAQEMRTKSLNKIEAKKRLSVELPEELIEKINLANQAKLAKSYDDTVAILLQKGLSALRQEIDENIKRQLAGI